MSHLRRCAQFSRGGRGSKARSVAPFSRLPNVLCAARVVHTMGSSIHWHTGLGVRGGLQFSAAYSVRPYSDKAY